MDGTIQEEEERSASHLSSKAETPHHEAEDQPIEEDSEHIPVTEEGQLEDIPVEDHHIEEGDENNHEKANEESQLNVEGQEVIGEEKEQEENQETEHEEKDAEENDVNESHNEANESQDDESHLKEKDEKKDEHGAVHHKKEIKRKARNTNKFADGNLIPEEGDDEEQNVHARSPGPPPLEPISQNLEDSGNFQIHKHDTDLLGSTTPDKIDVTLDEDYQEVEVEVKPTREEIIAKYQASVEERDKLQNVNNQLHHKLADYYRKRKSEEAQNQPLFDKSSQEQEQRYIKYLTTIEGLRKQLENEKLDFEREINDIKEKCDAKQAYVNDERMQFTKQKKEASIKSSSIHTGKSLSSKETELLLQREQQKEYEVVTVRLENIKLKNQLKKKESELKAKEELGEGLHMIDFEQLKIENQTYNEKIEERSEELMKLKKKINNTVQILSHVKEKLQFVYVENEKEKKNLEIYDEEVKRKRDILNRLKQSRDSLRADNARLKQNSGLLGNTVLLRDFEECVDKNDNLESQIELLKRRHAELVLNSKGLKSKISQTKSEKPI